MKNFLLLILIGALALPLTACNENASAPKIAVMDVNRLLRDSVPGKDGIRFIIEEQGRLQGRVEELQKKLEKNPQDTAAQRDLQKLFIEAQQQAQGDGQAVVDALLDDIDKLADAYRRQHGYSMILRVEALDSFDPGLDVTDAMMKEVDKIKLDFKTLLGANRAQLQESELDAAVVQPDASGTSTEEGKNDKEDNLKQEEIKSDSPAQKDPQQNDKNEAKEAAPAKGKKK